MHLYIVFISWYYTVWFYAWQICKLPIDWMIMERTVQTPWGKALEQLRKGMSLRSMETQGIKTIYGYKQMRDSKLGPSVKTLDHWLRCMGLTWRDWANVYSAIEKRRRWNLHIWLDGLATAWSDSPICFSPSEWMPHSYDKESNYFVLNLKNGETMKNLTCKVYSVEKNIQPVLSRSVTIAFEELQGVVLYLGYGLSNQPIPDQDLVRLATKIANILNAHEE